MALLAVPETAKFARLKRTLGLSKYATLGLLEALWHFTHRNAPRGDIGRFDNEEIAAWLEWDGEPDRLIQALVESRWLDQDEVHRLIVHDWHEHASNATKMALKRKDESFAVVTTTEDIKTVSPQCGNTVTKTPTVLGLPGTGAGTGAGTVKPTLTLPSQDGNAPKASPLCLVDLLPESHQTPEVQKVWVDYEQHRKEGRMKPYTPTASKTLAARLALMSPPDIVALISMAIERNWQGIPSSLLPTLNGHVSKPRRDLTNYDGD